MLGIKTILGLIPIHFHLKKLYEWFLLYESSLPSNHIISNILSSNRPQGRNHYISSIDHLTVKQRLQLKSPLINVDNKCNQFFLSFSFFNKKFKPGNRLMNLFSDHFSFHFYSSNTKKHIKKLDEIALRALSNSSSTIIVSDASIKYHVTTLISHIHSYNKLVIKTMQSHQCHYNWSWAICNILWNKSSSCQFWCQLYSDYHQLPSHCQEDIWLFSSSILNPFGCDIPKT